MGATGSGKSTFINLASGSNLATSYSLRSCTSLVQPAPTFQLDGHRVVLIDMPGFDDTTRSDMEILETIADFLVTSYNEGRLLTGVLYFHRISDIRVGGTSTKNLRMFKKLCGEMAFPNVIIVTNMWEGVDREVAIAREAELAKDDLFFKSLLRGGARLSRHGNTSFSARSIIRRALERYPQPLQIQVELVDSNMDISQTSAGEELNRELNALIKKYEEEIQALKGEMQQATRDRDEEATREIEIEAKKVENEIARLRNDTQRLGSNYTSKEVEPAARFIPTDAQEVNGDKVRYQGRTKVGVQQATRDREEEASSEMETVEREWEKEVAKLRSSIDVRRLASAYGSKEDRSTARFAPTDLREAEREVGPCQRQTEQRGEMNGSRRSSVSLTRYPLEAGMKAAAEVAKAKHPSSRR